jgi:hypothetical protein
MRKCCICHGRLKHYGERNGEDFCDRRCYYYFIENHPDCKPCNCPDNHLVTCIGWLSQNGKDCDTIFLDRSDEVDSESEDV